ncbi:myosin-related [Abeliophyllum distichum]|uniref:Myosin-related n=1 Tax=Abeliophyllum distichum TaxID=126358 RepID=A0ABD1RBP2_9LAMI
MSTTATMSRRIKWQQTAPPPPRSSRTRRKQPKSTACHHLNNTLHLHHSYEGKLVDQENVVFPKSDELSKNGEVGFEEGKWRFQAELLRDECNFLRTEREFALKKLEKNRVKMDRTLRSAVHTLISGKRKILEGKNENAVLEEGIEDLAEKLEEFQMNLRINTSRNLDQESSVNDYKSKNKSFDVDMLRRKMEGSSKGMLDRVEEDCGPLLSSTANSSVPGSASTSKRIDRFLEPSTFSTQQSYQEQVSLEENKCSGRCKAIISRIVEQVRVENEQWSQMQQMLERVRGEMDELQASREYWENHAHDLDHEIQSLRRAVREWRKKALSFENKANGLQVELTSLKGAFQKSKTELNLDQNTKVGLVPDLCSVSLRKQLDKEKHESFSLFGNGDEELNKEESVKIMPTQDLPAISLAKHLAKEKLHRLKEIRRADKGSKEELFASGRRKSRMCSNGLVAPKRSPLIDIGNSKAYSRVNL